MTRSPDPHRAVIAELRARVDAWRGFALGHPAEPWPQQAPRYEPVRDGEGEVSDTTRTLLRHWFRPEPHDIGRLRSIRRFRYWPHQRRLVETFIYLHEVCSARRAERIWQLGGVDPVFAQRDPWPKLGGQMATGSGKTKMMSLLIAWSYLNALIEREDHLGLGRHALLIAPGLFVKDRLLQDFLPEDPRTPSVFAADPVIPPEFLGTWALQVYVPDTCPRRLDPSEGALVVTNYHQLLRAEDLPPPEDARASKQRVLFDTDDPKKLEDVTTPLVSRFAKSRGILVLNDEAHHVWDEPGHGKFEERAAAKQQLGTDAQEAMAWIAALRTLNGHRERSGRLGLQADLSATLFEEVGSEKKGTKTVFRTPTLFRHTAVEYGLAEAIGDGIVKKPILERIESRSADGEPQPLVRLGQPDAWRTNETLIVAGIKRWVAVRDQLRAEGDSRKPILFMICEDRKAAREIANFLSYGDPSVEDLSTRTPTGWTNEATGERLFLDRDAEGAPISTVVEIHIGNREQSNEKEWEAVRRKVNAVDHDTIPSGLRDENGDPVMVPNPYNVVISVMMLKEGWDVRNVKVIVPLRSCDSRTLTEQTLGRGLRKMHAPLIDEDGAVRARSEDLFVIQHPSFEAILDQIGDLVEVKDSEEIEHPPEYIAIVPREPLAERRKVDVRLVRFEGIRRRVDDWRAAFSVKALPAPEKRFDWRESFDDSEIQTFLREAGSVEDQEGHTFTLSAIPSYRDYDHIIEVAYATPMLVEMKAAFKNKNGVKSVVKEFLETRIFKLPAGIPLSFDRAIDAGPESGRLAIGNLLRGEVIEAVQKALRGPLREAIFGKVSDEKPLLPERDASALEPYQAIREYVLEAPTRTVYQKTAVENNEELRCAELLDRARDVTGWLYNHRSGVGYTIEYDWLGYVCHYYPDFIARAQLGGRTHNFLVEVKGRMDERDEAKATAGRRAAGLLNKYDREPWHYLLLLENPARARHDLTWWQAQSVTTMDNLVRHMESLNGAEASEAFAWQCLTAAEIEARVIELAEKGDGGLSYARIVAMGEAKEADPDRALITAERLANGRKPTLRRVFRDARTGAEIPEPRVAEVLARSNVGTEAEDQGWVEVLEGMEMSFEPAPRRA